MTKGKKLKINFGLSQLNKAYIPYLQRQERYQIFYGGAGSGKSNFLATNLSLSLLQRKQRLLVVMETYAGMEEKVYKEIISALEKLQVLQFVKKKTSPLKIEFPNGSEMIFIGADDESKLLSLSAIDAVWVEEATGISKDYWEQLKLRLRGATGVKKKFYLSFNPISVNHWLKEEFFDKGYKDMFICHTTYKDNRFLDEEYIQTLEDMKERSPLHYDVYALGKWGSLGKKVFNNWTVQDFDVMELIKENPQLEETYGVDFGFVSDASTLVASLIDIPNRKLYIFDELYEKGLLNNQLAQKIIDKGYRRKHIIADSAEQKSIAELKQYGLTSIEGAAKGAGSIAHGIQYLQQFDIIIHPSCKFTIQEFEHYSYKKDKKTGQYLSQPIDDYNHCITGDTLIDTPDGQKRIDELVGTEGQVYAFDIDTNKRTIGNYSDVRKTRTNAEVFELRLVNGRVVKATADHMILTQDGWKELQQITTDDYVVDINIDTPKYVKFDDLIFTRDNATGYYLNSSIGERLHRYVWQYHNGTIPPKHEIHHIDHNKNNNDISNLQCLHRTEHRRLHALNSQNYQINFNRTVERECVSCSVVFDAKKNQKSCNKCRKERGNGTVS